MGAAWGERHHRAKLTDAQAQALREYRQMILAHPEIGRSPTGRVVWSDVKRVGLPLQKDIALELGVSNRAVSCAMRSLTYVDPDDRTAT